VSDPVPYRIYNPRKETISDTKYTEKDAQKGEFLSKGQMLIEKMLEMSR
jgi:2,3-bisphosphoglycerate-independent phosphoglycerate mutase